MFFKCFFFKIKDTKLYVTLSAENDKKTFKATKERI